MIRDADTLYLMLMHEVRDKELTPEVIKDHIEHLKQLDASGKLVVCGPFLTRYGALKILCADSMLEAKRLAEADPFIKHGYSTYELLEFRNAHAGNRYLEK